MPYVRPRGNHLAIVHGARHPITKKVEQEVLLTIHSKAEALAVLGRTGNGEDARRLRALLEDRYPAVRFDWKEIERALDEAKDALPDLAPSREERAFGSFRENLIAFARQLVLADPQVLASGRALVDAHRGELEWVAKLIDWRLKMADEARPVSEWTKDPFGWRLALQADDVPPETEEVAADLLERGEIEKAETTFKILVDAFPSYAEGWNYLGLIALAQGEVDLAIERFEKTVRTGRTLFPKRLAKKDYWELHETRPYMRGLGNLALALTRAKRHDEALAVLDRIENECGYEDLAAAHRATVFLNQGAWRPAYEIAKPRARGSASDALIAALAAFELGLPDAAELFIHATLNRPRMVAITLGHRSPEPRDGIGARDHNEGVELRASLGAYLDRADAKAPRRSRAIWVWPKLAGLRAEVMALEQDREADDRGRGLKRLEEIRDWKFARSLAVAFAPPASAARGRSV